MDRPAPPKIAPKPGQVKVVRALYSYTAQQEDELSFNEGDVLYITEQISSPDWWKARCGTKSGLIPSNYVESKTDTVNNPVHDAARRGNIEFLQECLKAGVSPTGLDASGNSPLHWTARGNHLECAEQLIKSALVVFNNSRSFMSIQNKLGDTPLHYASSKGNVAMVKLLIEQGADPFVVNKDNETACTMAHDPEVKTLLQAAMITDWNENADEEYENDSEEDDAA